MGLFFLVITIDGGNHLCVCTHSVVSDSLRLHGLQPARLLGPWGFSRQEYWSELPCSPPGDLPNLRIEPESLISPALASRFFTTSATQEAPAQFANDQISIIHLLSKVWVKNSKEREFPCSLMVRTLCFLFQGLGFNSWSRN